MLIDDCAPLAPHIGMYSMWGIINPAILSQSMCLDCQSALAKSSKFGGNSASRAWVVNFNNGNCNNNDIGNNNNYVRAVR